MYVDRDEWLTIEGSARYLNLSAGTVRKYVRFGRLPACRDRRVFKIKRSDLDLFLKKQK
jgi:excisionase family DNA binding protein